MPSLYPSAAPLLILTTLLWTSSAMADDEIFAVSEILSQGRTVSAEFLDVNGDGRKDLMIAGLEGLPPAEQRRIRVYLQTRGGLFPSQPSHTVNIPARSAVYDVADLKDTPGVELVLLRPDGVSILSVAGPDTVEWHVPISGPSTVAASDDERGFDPYDLIYDDADQPLILVPQLGVVTILTPDGESLGQIRVGGRANYFVARKSSVFTAESDLQLYFDTAKLSIGDVNGDGRTDIVAATRFEIRVFLRREDGHYDTEPSYSHALNLISARDHSRGAGSVVSLARDVDNNGLLDLVVTQVSGTFSDTMTTTYFYRNHDGSWDLENPDETFVSEGTLSSDLLLDINGDDIYELVRLQFKFSLLEIVEVLLTRKMDSVVEVHRLQPNGRFEEEPSSRRKFSTGISFETFRPKGFMPQTGIDINADGLMDVVTSADGKAIEVYLGTVDEPFTRRTAHQKMLTTGRIVFTDYDDDGLLDFVLFDPQSIDAPLRIGRNRGFLPKLSSN